MDSNVNDTTVQRTAVSIIPLYMDSGVNDTAVSGMKGLRERFGLQCTHTVEMKSTYPAHYDEHARG
jgi:hypothetical protein